MPIVQPGQIDLRQFTPQTPGPNLGERLSHGIGEGMTGLINAMALQTRQDREEREFKSQEQLRASQTSGQDLENIKARDAAADTKRKLAAQARAGRMFNEFIGSGASQGALGTILATEKDPDAINAFLESVTKHTAQVNDEAMARKNAVDAQIAQSTSTAKISGITSESITAGNNAVITGAQASTATTQEGLQTRIMQAQLANIQSEIANRGKVTAATLDEQALKLWKGGNITAEDAWKHYGGTLPAGMDPMSRNEGKGMQQFRMTAKNAATMINVSNAEMDQLLAGGARISGKTAGALKLPADFGRYMIPSDQKELLATGSAMMSQYALMMTGKAMTDNEANRIALQVMPQVGDDDKVVASKQLRRWMIQSMAFDAAKGNRASSEIIGDVIKMAETKGMPPEFTRFLRKSQQDAMVQESKYAADPEGYKPPNVAGVEPANPYTGQRLVDDIAE